MNSIGQSTHFPRVKLAVLTSDSSSVGHEKFEKILQETKKCFDKSQLQVFLENINLRAIS